MLTCATSSGNRDHFKDDLASAGTPIELKPSKVKVLLEKIKPAADVDITCMTSTWTSTCACLASRGFLRAAEGLA